MDLAAGRLQKLGQQIEAGGLAGAIRPDQRVDVATANPQVDVADRNKASELLGQPTGFENELTTQSKSPRVAASAATVPPSLLFRTGVDRPGSAAYGGGL